MNMMTLHRVSLTITGNTAALKNPILSGKAARYDFFSLGYVDGS